MRRDLNIESIRIFSMFLIVLGHVLGGFIPLCPEGSYTLKTIFPMLAFFIPFHVNLFILISGYCGIKRIKSVFKVFQLVFVYSLLIALVSFMLKWGKVDLLSLILPLSHNPWWFMRIYFLLVLIAPIVIEPLSNVLDLKKWGSLVIVFLFMDVYLGYYCRMQTVNYDGYNLIHFVTIYIIGCSLRKVDIKNIVFRGVKLTAKIYFFMFLFFSVIKLLVHIIMKKYELIDHYSDYNNPFNILLAVCVFLCFLNLNVKNQKITFISSSVISVYLISEHPLVKEKLMYLFNHLIHSASYNIFKESICILTFILLLFVISIFIDKIKGIIVAKIYSIYGCFITKINNENYQNKVR